jgi:hypothetical protein
MQAPKNGPIVPTILPPKKEKRTEPAKIVTVKPAKGHKPVVVTPGPHKAKTPPAPVKVVTKKTPAPSPAPAPAKTTEASAKPPVSPNAATVEPQIQRKPGSLPAAPVETLKIPKLKLPPDGVSIVLLNGILSPISFKWENIPNADSYHFEISKDAKFTKIIESQDSKNNQLTISRSFPAGKFYWRLRSEKGPAKSKWSDTYTFEITD